MKVTLHHTSVLRRSTFALGLLAAALFAFVAAPVSAQLQDGTISFRSRAYDLNTGKFLYTENHTERWRGGKHVSSTVVYRKPGGEVIASKTITFAGDRTAPDFRLEDKRSQLVEAAKKVGGGRIQTQFRPAEGGEMQTAVINPPGPVVIDGGFDFFVRDNFDKLKAGQTMTANFVVTSRKTYFTCTISKVQETEFQGRKAIVFKMVPTNFVIRQLADAIYITYDLESSRLLRYRGQSNLESAPGGSMYDVNIVFDLNEQAYATGRSYR